MAGFERLLQPGQIGSVRTRNRMVKSAASMCYWHEDDTHYRTRWHERYRVDDDKFLPGLYELAEAVHAHGCPTFMQFWHDRPWQSPMGFSTPTMFDGPPIGASPVKLDSPGDFHNDVPRPLTVPDIEGDCRESGLMVDAVAAAWAAARVLRALARIDTFDRWNPSPSSSVRAPGSSLCCSLSAV